MLSAFGPDRAAVPSADRTRAASGAHPTALDCIMIYGRGDFGTLAHAFRDVQAVESVTAQADQIFLLAPPGRNILPRLIELAEACDVDVTVAVVLRDHADPQTSRSVRPSAPMPLGQDRQ